MNADYMGPVKHSLNAALKELRFSNDHKHWFCGGERSIALAVQIIKANKIIAVPTDTIYGLTGLAQDSSTIEKLYAIKRRDESKPLAICVGSVSEIGNWGEVSHLPEGLLENLLPGPVTVVLNRTPNLNPELNPGIATVGIRIPETDFLRHVIKIVGEPLALTSANESNSPSTLHPDEFQSLWPLLGGIFYDNPNKQVLRDKNRLGSTIVDLTEPGVYKIIRPGMASIQTNGMLQQLGLIRIKERKVRKAMIQEKVTA